MMVHRNHNMQSARCNPNFLMFFVVHLRFCAVIVALTALTTSCASYRAEYYVPLHKVTVLRAAPEQQYSESELSSPSSPLQRKEVEVDLIPNETYRAPLFQMNWFLSPQSLTMKLRNTSADTLYIDWSKAIYRDESGAEYRVALDDTDPRFAGREHRTSRIVPGEELEERCYPTKCVVQYGRSFSRYPLLPLGGFSYKSLANELNALLGKELELWLPIDTRTDSYTYILTFIVQQAMVQEPQL